MTATFIPPGLHTGTIKTPTGTAPIHRPAAVASTIRQADVLAALDMLGIPTANLVEVTVGLRAVRIVRNARDEEGILVQADGSAEHTVDVRRIVR